MIADGGVLWGSTDDTDACRHRVHPDFPRLQGDDLLLGLALCDPVNIGLFRYSDDPTTAAVVMARSACPRCEIGGSRPGCTSTTAQPDPHAGGPAR